MLRFIVCHRARGDLRLRRSERGISGSSERIVDLVERDALHELQLLMAAPEAGPEQVRALPPDAFYCLIFMLTPSAAKVNFKP
jgi:hypothetical protein